MAAGVNKSAGGVAGFIHQTARMATSLTMQVKTEIKYVLRTKRLLAAALPPTTHHENRITTPPRTTNTKFRTKSLPNALQNTFFHLEPPTPLLRTTKQ
jgi:hypothetical protein